jgi:tumor protein p53-inducible protein 3
MGLDSVMVMIGWLGGTNIEAGSIAPILQKRIHVKGTTLRSRSLEYKSKLTKEMTEFTLERFKVNLRQ